MNTYIFTLSVDVDGSGKGERNIKMVSVESEKLEDAIQKAKVKYFPEGLASDKKLINFFHEMYGQFHGKFMVKGDSYEVVKLN